MSEVIRTSIIYTICCAALLFSACSQSDIPEPAENPQKTSDEVRFDVTSIQTKGTLIQDVEEIESLGIFGYSTGRDTFNHNNAEQVPNLLYNQLAKKTSEGEWEYSPMAYWPKDSLAKNTFFAYSPHSSQFSEDANIRISGSNTSGNPTLRYTLPKTLSQQLDILYAAPVENINKGTNNGHVHYDMKHAMTWLAFVVAPVPNNSNGRESFTVNWLSFMADSLTTTATLDLRTGNWTNPDITEAMYEFELTEAAENIKPGQAPRIITASDRLLLFPITIDGEASGATIDITYTYDPALENEEYDIEEYYYFIPFPTTKLTAGNIVVYMINISVDGTSLSFLKENSIEEWHLGEGKEIEIF